MPSGDGDARRQSASEGVPGNDRPVGWRGFSVISREPQNSTLILAWNRAQGEEGAVPIRRGETSDREKRQQNNKGKGAFHKKWDGVPMT